jgi:hypothetical protein
MKAVLLPIYFLSLSIAYGPFVIGAVYSTRLMQEIVYYQVLLVAIPLAILSGAALTWKTKNWFYIIVSVALPFLFIQRRY